MTQKIGMRYLAEPGSKPLVLEGNEWVARVELSPYYNSFVLVRAKDKESAMKRAAQDFWHDAEAWARIETLSVRRVSGVSRSWIGEDNGSGEVTIWVSDDDSHVTKAA